MKSTGSDWKHAADWWVEGLPKPQPRGRAFAQKQKDGKFRARVFEAGTAENWKSIIAAALGSAPRALEGPVRVDLGFYFPRPKRLERWKDPQDPIPHDRIPDRDNLEKAVLDCLTQLGWIRDDAQVCAGEVRKFYTSKGGKPGAQIIISTWRER